MIEAYYNTHLPYPYILLMGKGLLVLSAFLMIISQTKKNSNLQIIASLSCIVIMALIVMLNYDTVGYTRNGHKMSALKYNWNTIFSSLAFLGVGYFLNFRKSYRKLIIYSFLFMSSLVIVFADFSRFSLRMSGLRYSTFSHYTYLADLYIIVSIILFAQLYESKKSHLWVIVLTIVCLVFLNSRSALILYCLSCTIFYLLTAYLKAYQKTIIVVVLASLYFSLTFLIPYLEQHSQVNTRFLNALRMDKNDRSFKARENFNESGFKSIKANFITGDFAGQLSGFGDREGIRWGTYMHNGFSFWRQFGLLAFIAFIVSILHTIFNTYTLRKHDVFLVLLSCFVILCYIASRSYMNYYLVIVFGYTYLKPKYAIQ
ncbi:MAG: hypothetical protein NE330_16850 [Lentisphaeraceae bacterium]|nr:hypothetical protein [Lentisphaeraceae bacterium]